MWSTTGEMLGTLHECTPESPPLASHTSSTCTSSWRSFSRAVNGEPVALAAWRCLNMVWILHVRWCAVSPSCLTMIMLLCVGKCLQASSASTILAEGFCVWGYGEFLWWCGLWPCRRRLVGTSPACGVWILIAPHSCAVCYEERRVW